MFPRHFNEKKKQTNKQTKKMKSKFPLFTKIGML